MPKFIVRLISTFFYAGYFPLIPGTFASIAGLCLYFFIARNFYLYAAVSGVITLAGFITSAKAEKLFAQKDSRYIVIDEVSGMLLSLLFLPYDIRLAVGAFIVFRIFDALKPYPISKAEKLKGGLGVMADDILAAVYTNIIFQVVIRLASFRG